MGAGRIKMVDELIGNPVCIGHKIISRRKPFSDAGADLGEINEGRNKGLECLSATIPAIENNPLFLKGSNFIFFWGGEIYIFVTRSLRLQL